MRYGIAGLALAGVLAAAGEAGASTFFQSNVNYGGPYNDFYLYGSFSASGSGASVSDDMFSTTLQLAAPAPGPGSSTASATLSNLIVSGDTLGTGTLTSSVLKDKIETTASLDFIYGGTGADVLDLNVMMEISNSDFHLDMGTGANPANVGAYVVGFVGFQTTGSGLLGSMTVNAPTISGSTTGIPGAAEAIQVWITDSSSSLYSFWGVLPSMPTSSTFDIYGGQIYGIGFLYQMSIDFGVDPLRNLNFTLSFQDPGTSVPEPSAMALLGLGAAAAVARVRRVGV